MGKRTQKRPHDVARNLIRQPASAEAEVIRDIGKAQSVDAFHRKVRAALGLARVKRLHDVGVLQQHGHARLLDELLPRKLVAEAGLIIFSATVFSAPPSPRRRANQTSPIPPTPTAGRSSYPPTEAARVSMANSTMPTPRAIAVPTENPRIRERRPGRPTPKLVRPPATPGRSTRHRPRLSGRPPDG